MNSPSTRAGQWLLDRSQWDPGLRAFRVRINATASPDDMHRHILAIEAEAREQLAPVVVIEGPEEDGSYGVSLVAMPGQVGAGMTIAEAATEAADAAEAWLEAKVDEAREQERARIRAAVEALPMDLRWREEDGKPTLGMADAEPFRAAVLAIINDEDPTDPGRQT